MTPRKPIADRVRPLYEPSFFKTCQQCGCSFKVYVSQIRIGDGKYCSQKCYDVARASKDTPEQKQQKATERAAKWYLDNTERAKANRKSSYLKDPKLAVAKVTAWKKANPKKANAQQRLYRKRKRLRDPVWAITDNVRRRINEVLASKGLKMSVNREKLFGCTKAFLLQYLASKFLPGMTWENRGPLGWHVDHIKAVSLFDFTDPEQIHACSHYSNLQPMWWRDNIIKSNKCQ
jgi:Prasinovirus endonuclease VII